MANLITDKQKKIVRTDYFVRLFSVSLFIPISLLGAFLLAYLIPYYFAVSKKDTEVAAQFKSVINIENKENIGDSSIQMIGQTLDEMKIIEMRGTDNFIPSEYFNKIIENKNNSIKITKLSFTNTEKGADLFLVSGVSKNREGLVAFINDLKSKAGFINVELPISSLAIDSNISFSLSINITR